MKKVICFLLIISIIISIFAESMIFKKKNDLLKKRLYCTRKASENRLSIKSYYQGLIDGEKVAKADKICFLVGFYGGILGIIFSYIMPYNPNNMKDLCIGKDKMYIKGFKKGYSQKKKTLNVKYTLYGLFSALGVILIYGIICIVFMFSVTAPYFY